MDVFNKIRLTRARQTVRPFCGIGLASSEVPDAACVLRNPYLAGYYT